MNDTINGNEDKNIEELEVVDLSLFEKVGNTICAIPKSLHEAVYQAVIITALFFGLGAVVFIFYILPNLG